MLTDVKFECGVVRADGLIRPIKIMIWGETNTKGP